jgi:predicted aminopeptidase
MTVEPVAAYSTLGWFDDPVPSSVIDWPQARLAGLIFHELAHQRLYLSGDSAFNEAFATLVEREGIVRWLQAQSGAAAVEVWQTDQRREQSFVDLLLQTRRRLEALYESPGAVAQKRQRKAGEFQRMRAQYRGLKREWNGFDGYDEWFEREPNNARLAAVATYEHWVPAFRLLLVQAGGRMDVFYQACDRLSQLPTAERHEQMEALRVAALRSGLSD